MPTPPPPSTAASDRQLQKRFTSLDGTTPVWYWEYLPADYASGARTYPLLVFFHGADESGPADGSTLAKVKRHGPPKLIAGDHDMCFDTPAGRECFIVVSPQNSRGWWTLDDTAGMVKHALTSYRVDPKRVYVTGLSMGGGATWGLATATEAGTSPAAWWAAKIAAAAPICGAADSRVSHGGICNGIVGSRLPVWAFHGDQDPTVSASLSRAWVDKINGQSSDHGYVCAQVGDPAAKLTLYAGVQHDSWTRTYDPACEVEPGRNLYQWLLSHRRP